VIASRFRTLSNRVFDRWGRLFVWMGLTPNHVTLLGLLLGTIACAILVWTRNVPLFVLLIVVAALFDAADGMVARITQSSSRFGSYLDAVCDRVFEGFVGLSVAWVTGQWALIFFGYIGFTLISYTKARAALEVNVTNDEWPDLMERGERDVIFIVALLLSDLVKVRFLGQDLFFWIGLVLIVLVYVTAIQRILRARQFIESRAEGPSPGRKP
jgi:archaetidylinositol phosphate synthase